MLWNTDEILDFFLRNFSGFIDESNHPAIVAVMSDSNLRLAIVGFRSCTSGEIWTNQQSEFVKDRIKNDFSDGDGGWGEEYNPALIAFSCLVLGGIMGKHFRNEIDDNGFFYGEVELASFVAMNGEEICTRYRDSQ